MQLIKTEILALVEGARCLVLLAEAELDVRCC
jgi:hypothetical protein